MNNIQKNQFLSAKEVANVFFEGKIHYQRVLKMTREGILPGMKQGKSYVYFRSALEHWAERTLSKPTWAHK